jgi:tetratricopeptide (TPR) repeat protein
MNAMKKTIILVSLALIILAGCSPKAKVTSSQNLKETGKLKEAMETMEEAIDPSNEKAEKTLNWPRTWEVRGEIFQAVYQSEDESVKSLAEDPLTEALKSYKKALELDEKDKFSSSIKVKLTLLINDLTNQAVEAFNEDNYSRALRSFEQILEVQDIDIIEEDNPGVVDTVIIFNAGLAAYNNEDYDKAIKYYREAAKHGYNEDRTYTLLSSAYKMEEDTLGALDVLKEGFEKYPDNEDILTNMIQAYLDLDKTEEAMKYLKIAIENDPDNATFHFAMGTLHEKVENIEKAIDSYEKAIEADPDFFNAHFNLGALYYNEGVQQIEVANSIPTSENERYQEELEKADKWFKRALPYMEKCHELQPDDNMSMESLKNLYYRLEMMDKYNEMLEKLGQS